MELKFRALGKDDVECRIGTVNDKGCSLLLYKNARVDMAVLDETVGPMRWQRSHSRDNANCTVSIYDESTGQWVSKEDTGTESNTEAEKGLASDSFKRACFNWGIGRELYTAPFIWFSVDKCNIKQGRNGKPSCFDRFTVDELTVEGGRITSLVVANETTQAVFSWRYKAAPEKQVRSKAAKKKQDAQERQAAPTADIPASSQDAPQAPLPPVAMEDARYAYFLILAEFCARTGKVQERVHAGYEKRLREASGGEKQTSQDWSVEDWQYIASSLQEAMGR